VGIGSDAPAVAAIGKVVRSLRRSPAMVLVAAGNQVSVPRGDPAEQRELAFAREPFASRSR
jgi:hypothetical protein